MRSITYVGPDVHKQSISYCTETAEGDGAPIVRWWAVKKRGTWCECDGSSGGCQSPSWLSRLGAAP